MHLAEEYTEKLKNRVLEKIQKDINAEFLNTLVVESIFAKEQSSEKASKFHAYYRETTGNEERYQQSVDFFKEFKSQYSLQGINNEFLDKLNSQREEILKLIKADKIVELYFSFFHQVELTYNNKRVNKDLGSFVSKLVHTFKPEKYCALDNPIKNYLGLSKESFFVAFLIINEAYREWADKNKVLIKNMRMLIKENDKHKDFDVEKLTDLKILDLIFWGKANAATSKEKIDDSSMYNSFK